MVDLAELVLANDSFGADWNSITCIAIAMAESGGYDQAVNVIDNPSSRAYRSADLGLWQVNTYWHPTLSMEDSFNPVTQLEYVDALSDTETWRRDWTPWHVFTAEKHKQFISAARAAINEVSGEDPV